MIGCLFVSLHVRVNPKLSIFDEMVHADYLIKVTEGQLVHTGDRIGPGAMQEAACRGFDVAQAVPPCGSQYTPDQFPALGFNSADIHTPVYYFITGLGARFLMGIHVTMD